MAYMITNKGCRRIRLVIAGQMHAECRVWVENESGQTSWWRLLSAQRSMLSLV
jgi:hypothetical protein